MKNKQFELTHKGFTGEYSMQEDGMFYGKILNIEDLVTFEGYDKTIEQSFIDAVEDYIYLKQIVGK